MLLDGFKYKKLKFAVLPSQAISRENHHALPCVLASPACGSVEFEASSSFLHLHPLPPNTHRPLTTDTNPLLQHQQLADFRAALIALCDKVCMRIGAL